MNPKTENEADAAREAVADLQGNAFDGAKRALEVARFILAGTEPQEGDALAEGADQATREPRSDTVQKPAAE